WSQGERSALKLVYVGGEKDKTSFKHLTCFGADASGKATLHVFIPPDCATLPSMGLAVSTSLGYVWHESKGLPLKHGWNALEFPLASPHWKTQKTQWAFTAGIDLIKEIRAVNLIIYNTKDTGWLLVDGLHFDPDETGKKVAKLIEDLLGEDFVARAQAEGELVTIGRPALEALYQQRTTDRMEIILRVGAITRKIEAMEEELPKDNPELKEQILKQREEAFFNEASVRADFVLKGFKTEREKAAKLVKDAKDELARGRMEFAKLEYTAEEDKKAYKEMLDKLERYAQSLEESLATMPDPESERRKQEAMMNDPAKMEAMKMENEKKEAATEAEEKKMAEKIEAERKAEEAKDKPLEVPTLKPLKKKPAK
ncbi:MAG: hypothetical protein KIS92_25940, partial [Planctomycetota bacterium]|nr:hypothetical protein [Planctomycetota bacterium]